MTQYNFKVLNYPDPLAEEAFVTKVAHACALARAWSEAAAASGLEGLLRRGDRAGCQDLVRKARMRRILSAEGAEEVRRLAAACAKSIATLIDYDAPATRTKAAVLIDRELELHALAIVIEEALDLETALEMRHRITCRTAEVRRTERVSLGRIGSDEGKVT